ncbi:Agenet-like domain-containing protein [Thalictrum thalictroides]|uniref:Agenet-like domain-containing protein n=1 Tax=Thalictrum thalictroides TaxID=46969 RepID=A0A7J6VQ92_THATH|nr:Agenet-like domain-containing protein [Thalictrum thalictroides]
MQPHQNLPFKVGQLAELKTFETGFRGAWFRCKINRISKKKGHIQHYLKFYDFPDEKVQWTKLYQKQEKERDIHLMVRPSFPSIYCESQMQDPLAASDVIAVVDDAWKVGDLVDWWTDGCYWCGRITHLLGEDKVKIKLHDPPVGEGQCYEASCKDLRPSLDWSPERGWTLPISSVPFFSLFYFHCMNYIVIFSYWIQFVFTNCTFALYRGTQWVNFFSERKTNELDMGNPPT